MSGFILYGIALMFLVFSFLKDRQKTKLAIIKAWKSLVNLLPQVTAIMIFVGVTLALLSPAVISSLIGSGSGVMGIVIALSVGSITLIPGFVAFPLAAALLKGGAGYPQIAAFVSTVMAVGIMTLPAEIRYLNKQVALLRNGFAFIISVIFTILIGQVMK